MSDAEGTTLRDILAERGRVLTRDEVAAVFRVSSKTVTEWAHNGTIPHFKTPCGHHRFWERDIITALDADRTFDHPLRELARQIMSLDDPYGPGQRLRKSVTLNDIITWAREALELTARQRASAPMQRALDRQ